MNPKTILPRQALNKAFLKVKPSRVQIELFKSHLKTLLEHTNDHESEEHHKNLVSDFLKKTYYDPRFFINTKDRKDLVIHTGSKPDTSTGVIIEAKKPTNKSEMPMRDNLNAKAFHELLYYYLQERITHNNLDLKHLIITNIHEWYIFDAHRFEACFAQNKKLVASFTDFSLGRSSGNTTDFFYKQIAAPAIAALEHELQYTYIDVRDYEKPLRNHDPKNDNKLIVLYKLLSPEHLLKLPFANDSNSLDKRFYGELLHIIGLTENKEGGKKIIGRHVAEGRLSGSLLENAIGQLDTLDKISRLERQSQYGATQDDRLFNVGLELAITWINRILFLKLLEAQLISYHKGDKRYAFLHSEKVGSYDDLEGLFFQVLARKHEERGPDLNKRFGNVPYLNSSLFEPTDIEHATISISNLRDDRTLPVYTQTVLKDQQGRKLTGQLDSLRYLFLFLEAYDFSSEGSEEIQEENKSLINASVLGLIFEKINGYKDGSFFTPGFITMYMCRETIRRSVVQKFEATKGWTGVTFETLYNKIEDIQEANTIINSLRICDPAVGTGHVLVSALNEIISIKNDLRILTDRHGKRLKEYHVEVVNDELIITDEDSELFEYHPGHKESQRMQEALFHEKQTLIENCLFGVDINPNSVKICRLRLWIELLKHAYYKNERELETLPNIDINIKCGNSLVSRFDLNEDIKPILKKNRFSIDGYRVAVDAYRNAENKEQKRQMMDIIQMIKADFQTSIPRTGKLQRDLDRKNAELYRDYLTPKLIDIKLSASDQKKIDKEKEKLDKEIAKLELGIEEIQSNKIFENAFEWRFEFPEVLDDDGEFVGFDVVIGNPPYIRHEELTEYKPHFQRSYETYAGTADLYVYFVEKGMSLLKFNGDFIYILPNKWMRAGYGAALRNYIRHYAIQQILDFGDLPVFEEATTYPCIMHLVKGDSVAEFESVNVDTLDFPEGLKSYVSSNSNTIPYTDLLEDGWALKDRRIQDLLNKIRSKGVPLSEYVNGKIFYGIKTGLNEAFVIDRITRDRLIEEDPKSEEIIKPFLAGRDIKRYEKAVSDKFLILIKSGDTQSWFGKLHPEIACNKMKDKYPSIMHYLLQFETKAKERSDQGHYWWELRSCDYYEEFEKEKIVLPDISLRAQATIESTHSYCGNTSYIIPLNDPVLLAVLNSNIIHFYYSNSTSSIRGGYMRFIRQYLSEIPIIIANESQRQVISFLVNQILQNQMSNGPLDKTEIDLNINIVLYNMYELTEEEIEIVSKSI